MVAVPAGEFPFKSRPMTDSHTLSAPSRLRSRALVAASFMLLGCNLRPAFSSLGPVLPEVMRDTGIGSLGASILSTAPVLCLGIFGPLAPGIARRYGPERTVLVFLIVLALGSVLRGVPGALPLFAGSILCGIGIGIINVLVPGLIKRDFPQRTALMLGVHAMMLCAGGALGAGLAVPLAQAFAGSWGASLAFWGLPALASVLLWLPLVPRRAARGQGGHMRVRGLWRDGLAWQVTLFMAFQSAVFYAGLGWLPPILRARGLSPENAGLVISISILIQLGSSFAAPPLAAKGRDQRWAVLTAEVLLAVGVLGCLFAPLSLIWASTVILGLGQGATFALALAMIVLRSRDAHVAAQLSSMVQGVGYTVASGASLVTGVIYGSVGGLAAVGVLFAVLIALGAIAGWGAGRNLFVKATLETAGP
jgi:CP family cyanate transporter-like MFS transporter